jgi:maltose alpha-D-glucosyltransferase/alpha-amylase
VTDRRAASKLFAPDPTWYKDAIIYEVHVRAFADSDGDGRGDFRGLASRLDYVQQLGVTAIWLLPFYPSPLRDDGYDIADYTSIHPDYGTLADFRAFVNEAHRRGLRVITELVLNHTSDQHPWFQRARRSAPGSSWRNFYVWSDTPDRYRDARIIFQDFESSNWSWDPVARAYYWHRFYSHQPDLNFNHPVVRRNMLRIVDFWLNMGVDGLRLDAVPYLYEEEGTDCENLPETHDYLRALRQHIDGRYSDRMLLAEANQWPEDAIAYFGDDDECHMAFHFPLMPRLFMALRMEDRFPIIDILQQTPALSPDSQWAIFLRNHDELTLEMVTDEERDYMYRSYARDPVMRVNLGIRRRLAPLLGFHRQKIELMYGLLMSLPGTPVLYYGDEIGMGDNVYLGDRDSVRTPMQWSPDRNAGFSSANPHQLYLPVNIDPQCHYESINVAAQRDNPDSILRWVRRLTALRKRHSAFARGRMEFVQSDNPRVFSFLRVDDREQVLVVANLSRFAQYVELDLKPCRGMTPLELFGQTQFPMIGDLPYLITLTPYSFMWLELVSPARDEPSGGQELPILRTSGSWWQLVERSDRRRLEAILPALLVSRRWFASKDRRIHSASIAERVTLELTGAEERVEILAILVEYLEGEPEFYHLPIVHLTGERADALLKDHHEAVYARIESREGAGFLADAHFVPGYGHALLAMARAKRSGKPSAGAIRIGATVTNRTAGVLNSISLEERSAVRVLTGEQSNTSLLIGEPDGPRAVMKSFRKLARGEHPEVEIDKMLTDAGANIARLIGTIELLEDRAAPVTLSLIHEYVPNEGDAWASTLAVIGAYLEQASPSAAGTVLAPAPAVGITTASLDGEIPAAVRGTIPATLGAAELLGRRTAELHLALAEGGDNPSTPLAAFRPERVSPLKQRALYQSMRTTARRALAVLRRGDVHLDPDVAALVRRLLEREDALMETIEAVRSIRTGVRIRIHGDLHLGQVLFTGRDYVFIDFEGEPARSFEERRLKRSPLRDVAGMLRSYHYVAHAGVDGLTSRGEIEPGSADEASYRAVADDWASWVSIAFLQSYIPLARSGDLLPAPSDLEIDLRAHLIDKALYELRYELANRPNWVHLPLLGLCALLGDTAPLGRSSKQPRPPGSADGQR